VKHRMSLTIGTLIAALVLSVSGLVVGTHLVANAATESPFDPADSGATQGTLRFFDASGDVLTGGPLDAEPAYVKADTDTGRDGDNLATLFAYTPEKGVLAANWSGFQLGAPTTYPITAGAPANLLNKNQAVAKSPFLWFADDEYPDVFPNTNTDVAWQGVYQLRMYTSGPGQALDVNRYASATINVDTATDTWTLLYPDPDAQPPVVDSPATITGTAKVGTTLSCDVAFTGADSVTFSWLRDGKAISGATDTDYKAVASDHKAELKCRAKGTNTSGSTNSTSTGVTVALGDALQSTSAPTVSGKAKVKKTLTCAPGSWSPKAASYKYQWLKNNKAIGGETSKTFDVPAKAKGWKVACKVTALKKGYANGVAKSAAVTIK
jgi:hypothetical protein